MSKQAELHPDKQPRQLQKLSDTGGYVDMLQSMLYVIHMTVFCSQWRM